MPSPHYLSKKKKTERLSFTITPLLKNEIRIFFEEERKKNPKNPEFKSISSFCYHALKDILEIRKKGVNLQSLKSLPDTKTKDFYDQITFRALTHNFEIGIAPNKYIDDNIKIPNFAYTFRKYILATIDPRDSKSFQAIVEKVKSFLLSNQLTKELRIDLFHKTKNKYPSGVIEYIGNYVNLHYENCKAFAALLGVMGVKIKDFTFSEKDIYARFDFEETELFYKHESLRKHRRALLEENLRYLINYEKIINDKPEYLWSKLSKSKDIFLNFITPVAFEKWFKKIISDIREFGEKDTFLLNLLKTCEKMHWISIEDEEELSFRIKVRDEKSESLLKLEKMVKEKYGHDKELNELMDLLTHEKFKEEILIFKSIEPHANIRREGDVYYLEKDT